MYQVICFIPISSFNAQLHWKGIYLTVSFQGQGNWGFVKKFCKMPEEAVDPDAHKGGLILPPVWPEQVCSPGCMAQLLCTLAALSIIKAQGKWV